MERDELPFTELAKRFRARAQNARSEASNHTGTARATLLQVAEQWDLLADEAEVMADRR